MDSLFTRMLQHFDYFQGKNLVCALEAMSRFQFRDDELIGRIVRALAEHREYWMKIDSGQVLAVLRSIADLGIEMPERAAMHAFSRLEYVLDSMATPQIVGALEMAHLFDMSISPALMHIVQRAYEQRDSIRTHDSMTRVMEEFCVEYSADLPEAWAVAFLRKKWSRERQIVLSERLRQQQRGEQLTH
jgi:hypothetical protein